MAGQMRVKTSALADRVVLVLADETIAFEKAQVLVDEERGMVHLFDEKGETHFASLPATRAFIYWDRDAGKTYEATA